MKPSPAILLAALLLSAGSASSSRAQEAEGGVRVEAYFAMAAIGQTRKRNAGREAEGAAPTFGSVSGGAGFTAYDRVPLERIFDDEWLALPAYGAGIRVEAPMNDWLAIGGMFELLRQPLDAGPNSFDELPEPPVDPDPSWAHPLTSHYDIWIEFSRLQRAERRVPIELYVGVPVGFTFSTLSRHIVLPLSIDPNAVASPEDFYPYTRDNWYGWNTGLLTGSSFLLHERFAMSVEIGWRMVQVFNRARFSTASDYWGAVRSTTNYASLNVGAALTF